MSSDINIVLCFVLSQYQAHQLTALLSLSCKEWLPVRYLIVWVEIYVASLKQQNIFTFIYVAWCYCFLQFISQCFSGGQLGWGSGSGTDNWIEGGEFFLGVNLEDVPRLGQWGGINQTVAWIQGWKSFGGKRLGKQHFEWKRFAGERFGQKRFAGKYCGSRLIKRQPLVSSLLNWQSLRRSNISKSIIIAALPQEIYCTRCIQNQIEKSK